MSGEHESIAGSGSGHPVSGAPETAAVGAEPLFFPVSAVKLVVLSIFTLGIYEFYWFYKNWGLIRKRGNSDISPFWRTFFGYFFCYALFAQVRDQQNKLAGSKPLPAGPLAAGWIILNLLWRLPDPYWLVCFAAVLFLVPVQLAAERINAAVAPGHDRNARFTGWNWVGIAVGVAMLVLVLVGTFLVGDDL
jgi:Domain of unknown function (DUF4234)